ncbi:hypothetical protein CC80DRAFT_204823 [Byssothecium circinans]|uniref:Uncharacterized protein n=1 Tax=Byssothecium circinans TaxID=147558 RepID=A0A6A5TLA5_9PLEO|nr:hypothetical protein CC80DRAFT_204823 [Byssothecium circinans]
MHYITLRISFPQIFSNCNSSQKPRTHENDILSFTQIRLSCRQAKRVWDENTRRWEERRRIGSTSPPTKKIYINPASPSSLTILFFVQTSPSMRMNILFRTPHRTYDYGRVALMDDAHELILPHPHAPHTTRELSAARHSSIYMPRNGTVRSVRLHCGEETTISPIRFSDTTMFRIGPILSAAFACVQ